jgi:parvulin-like peptidyl-prolyl isomerase
MENLHAPQFHLRSKNMANPRENKPVIHTKKHIARLEREKFQTRLILFSFIGVVVIVVGLVVYGYLDVKYFQALQPIAKVANVNIPVGEWQGRVRMQREQLISQLQLYQQYSQYFGMDLSSQEQQITLQLNTPATMGQTVLDQMINEELVRQEAKKRGITASKDEVDKAIQASYQYYPNGSPTPTTTPTAVNFPTLSADTLKLVTVTPTPTATSAFTETPGPTATPNPLASPTATLVPTGTPTPGPTSTITPTDTPLPTSTPYTLQGFQDTYKKGVTQLTTLGLTEAQIRLLYESNVLHQKIFDVITVDVPRTQDQVWARHILVADQATANAVRQRLLNGEDFAKVAAEVSTDTGTKDKGGDLGWFGKGKMVPEFEAAAFSQKIGEIGQPVKSQFGYHIIQVLAHTEIPLDTTGYNQAKQTAFNDWLTKAKDEYKVVNYNNWQNLVPTDPAAPAVPQ